MSNLKRIEAMSTYARRLEESRNTIASGLAACGCAPRCPACVEFEGKLRELLGEASALMNEMNETITRLEIRVRTSDLTAKQYARAAGNEKEEAQRWRRIATAAQNRQYAAAIVFESESLHQIVEMATERATKAELDLAVAVPADPAGAKRRFWLIHDGRRFHTVAPSGARALLNVARAMLQADGHSDEIDTLEVTEIGVDSAKGIKVAGEDGVTLFDMPMHAVICSEWP